MATWKEALGFTRSKTVVAAEQALEDVKSERVFNESYVRESMMAILSIALEDRNWIRTDGFERSDAGNHLTLAALKSAARNGRALVTGNPIMTSAAKAQISYVWGENFSISGADTIVDDKMNKSKVFGRLAQSELELSKIADGNAFFYVEGRKVTTIPFYEIEGAVYDPNDSSFIRYFYRVWTERRTDFSTNTSTTITHKRLYPNLLWDEQITSHPPVLNGVPVEQLGVIRHVAPNKLSGGAWGVPDLLSGIFYAGEHKELLEAADAIFRAQSQYAVQYKAASQGSLERVAARVSGAPGAGEGQYGQSIGFGQDVEMKLMGQIGGGIDFTHFDPIAGLASVALRIPLAVVLGAEDASQEVPRTTRNTMRMHQEVWDEALMDIFDYMGKSNGEVKIFRPKLDPDPTHRQVQSIVGAAKLRIISPEQTYKLFRDTFKADWEDELPDPSLWDEYEVEKVNPGSVEGSGDGPVTPGQGQTGQLGKLADGDHELRDEGGQPHTQK